MLNNVYRIPVKIVDFSYIFKYIYLKKYIIISQLDFLLPTEIYLLEYVKFFIVIKGYFNESIYFQRWSLKDND